MIFLHFWKTFSLGEGFGFNGNILETNILNLAVVIFVVFSLGGDALKSLLENRKQAIIQNLKEVEQRAEEAQKKLNLALSHLESTKKKALEIKKQGLKTAEQERIQSIRQAEEDGNQLKNLQQETLRLQQQKAISQISHEVISLALKRVQLRFKNGLDERFQRSINNFHIVLLTSYNKKF